MISTVLIYFTAHLNKKYIGLKTISWPTFYFKLAFDVAQKCFHLPVRVVALHSWVWLVAAIETELLQREILGKVYVGKS